MTNQELADKLRELRDFLIIAGYEESHATRYTQIARSIEKLAEPASELDKVGGLRDIPQVGRLIEQYIHEILTTGKSRKQLEWEEHAPYTVVEMCKVKGLGPKTAKVLFQEFGIKSLSELKRAVESSQLDSILSSRIREAVRDSASG